MRERTCGLRYVLIPVLVIGFTAARLSQAAESRPVWRVGISYDHLSRTVTWDDKTHQSRLKADLITASGLIAFEPGLTLELLAGVSLSNFNGLSFDNLPITLDYESGATTSFLLGAGIRAKLLTFGDFEIEGTGRFVYSMGRIITWPMEGFAVEGSSTGRPTWFEASLGPRISYFAAAKFVPYLTISADILSGRFRMDETLADLSGTQTRKLKSKSIVSAALGADFHVSGRLALRGEAGFLPYSGGVDGMASLGLHYRF
jgi:hypothetical protein